MTPQLLDQVGTVLFGTDWLTPLGEALHVAQRTMERWKTNGIDPPTSGRIALELATMLADSALVVACIDVAIRQMTTRPAPAA